jgi:hypothetical protein
MEHLGEMLDELAHRVFRFTLGGASVSVATHQQEQKGPKGCRSRVPISLGVALPRAWDPASCMSRVCLGLDE